MEGVGARLGRSSSRYGTTTVFTGPVRKWKKKWVHVAPRSNHPNTAANRQHSSLANGRSNSSRLLLYRWTPISKSNKESNDNDGENKSPNSEEDDPESAAAAASEEPPRKKLRYIPVAALEEQQKDTEENNDDEAKPADAEASATEPTSKSDGHNEKPDINDVPMEENQDTEKERQDLNESKLDLSLGLTSQEGEQGSDLNMEPAKDDQ